MRFEFTNDLCGIRVREPKPGFQTATLMILAASTCVRPSLTLELLLCFLQIAMHEVACLELVVPQSFVDVSYWFSTLRLGCRVEITIATGVISLVRSADRRLVCRLIYRSQPWVEVRLLCVIIGLEVVIESFIRGREKVF